MPKVKTNGYICDGMGSAYRKSTVQFITPKYLQKVGGTFAPMGIGI